MTNEQPQNWLKKKHLELPNTYKEDLINAFKTAITAQKSSYDLVWEVVKQVNELLMYEDCVLYIYDEDKECLMQMAAYGEKKVNQKNIIDPIRIEPGDGIVGGVYLSGTPRIIGDTTLDGNYIIDDRFRLSEISIPILRDGEVIGVIDSEHPRENYYTANDAEILVEFAKLIATKLEEF